MADVKYVNIEEAEIPAEEPQKPGKLGQLVKSRKFWAALIGLVMVVVKGIYPDLPLDDGMVTNLIYILIAYITGTAIEDGLRG